MKAIGYARVSTVEQAEGGSSLQSQNQQIRAYCALKGLELADVHIDGGVSGGIPLAERPAGAELTAQLTDIQIVVITKLDRGFRDTVDCLQTVKAWEAAGVALHIIDMGGSSVDTTSAAGRFMLTVLVAAAEMEKNRIRERCNEGRRARKAQGKLTGTLLYGFDLDADGKTLLENPLEQSIIALCKDLRTSGHSLRAIAQHLTTQGVSTKRGGSWGPAQISLILKRAA